MDQLISKLTPDCWILDLGAGPGSFSYSTTPARVLSLDLAFPEKRQECTARATADSGRLPLPNDSIDLVVCNHTLEHFVQLDSALQEIGRVLKNGARLWVSVPDAGMLDDRLYRFLFRGGGHVNSFSLQSLIRRVEEQSAVRARRVKKLFSGFVYLRPVDRNRLRQYPAPARFLGYIPRPYLRFLLRWFNYSVRCLDGWLGTHLSQYGWAVEFQQPEESEPQSDFRQLSLMSEEINVCCGCGLGQIPLNLQTKRFLWWRLYTCVQCGTLNIFYPCPEIESRLGLPSRQAEESAAPEPETIEGLRNLASKVLGSQSSAAIERWVQFWGESASRSQASLQLFEPLVLIDFRHKRILDVGCGTAAMGKLCGDECQQYVGVDYHEHILRFAFKHPGCSHAQCNGAQLPFADQSFDYIFSLDVFEHIQGGLQVQHRFFSELRRVLRPLGMVFFSTPNRWYPYEGHTHLWGPQYLPRALADRYIARSNPAFLQEHVTFGQIRSLGPRALRHSLSGADLIFLHDLPCGMDRRDLIQEAPVKGALSFAGLGWWPHAEFWGILVAADERQKLRLKLRKNWYYEDKQPTGTRPLEFGPVLNFESSPGSLQLGPGWFWHERDTRGFRWIGAEATCYLQSRRLDCYIAVYGYAPCDNHIEVYVDGVRVGEHFAKRQSQFQLCYLIPQAGKRPDIFTVRLTCAATFRPKDSPDERQLGVMIFSVALTDKLT